MMKWTSQLHRQAQMQAFFLYHPVLHWQVTLANLLFSSNQRFLLGDYGSVMIIHSYLYLITNYSGAWQKSSLQFLSSKQANSQSQIVCYAFVSISYLHYLKYNFILAVFKGVGAPNSLEYQAQVSFF